MAGRAPSRGVCLKMESGNIMETHYIEEAVPGGVPLKMWTRGVPVEDEAKRQLANAARLAVVFKHGGNAGRALRHRRYRGLGHFHLQGHHPGRRRSGHRLWNDRLHDHAGRQ